MADIIAAVDETAANTLLHAAEAAVGTQSTPPGSGSLGPFSASWSASASFTGGTVSLAAPDTVSIDNIQINYSLSLTLAAGHEGWLSRLEQGTLVHVRGERAAPESVDILVGQTVVWAVEDAPGVSITDTTLIATGAAGAPA